MFARLLHPRRIRFWRSLPVAIAVLGGAVVAAQPALAAPAVSKVTFTKLALLNGWHTSQYGTASPAVADIGGVVHFKGAIETSSSNTNDVAFVLPPAFRPPRYITVPVDMCGASSGELNIAPTGVTQVISQGANSNATCFTSLDGVTFTLSTASFTQLKLHAGWTEFDNLFRTAAARLSGGIVQLKGEIKTAGTNPVAFTLPAKFRPSRSVYVLISLCTGSIGRLSIAPTGVVTVQPEGTDNWWMVKCGTSLEGASFALSPKSFTALTLQNGWLNAPYGTAKAAVRAVSGIVHFRGAIWTKGNDLSPFTLPTGFRPAKRVFIPVDLCNGNKGRLDILKDGVVTVEAEGNDVSQAECFTSLDGVSFAR
jgi:hypothetical protein